MGSSSEESTTSTKRSVNLYVYHNTTGSQGWNLLRGQEVSGEGACRVHVHQGLPIGTKGCQAWKSCDRRLRCNYQRLQHEGFLTHR